FLEGDRHQRLSAGGWSLVVPGEGEDDLPVGDDLAIDPAEPVLAMLRGLDHAAVGAARAEIDLGRRAGEARRPHPALHMLGPRPQLEEQRGRRIEGAGDEQLVVGNVGDHWRFALALTPAMEASILSKLPLP